MTVEFSRCTVVDLMAAGLIQSDRVEDVLGNAAVLNSDGSITLDANNVGLSFTRSARVHNLIVNGVDKRVDPWRYWYVFIDGYRVQLKRLREIIVYGFPVYWAFDS